MLVYFSGSSAGPGALESGYGTAFIFASPVPCLSLSTENMAKQSASPSLCLLALLGKIKRCFKQIAPAYLGFPMELLNRCLLSGCYRANYVPSFRPETPRMELESLREVGGRRRVGNQQFKLRCFANISTSKICFGNLSPSLYLSPLKKDNRQDVCPNPPLDGMQSQ